MSEPCKVHVGNLSYDATEDDIRDCFEKYGTVEQVIVVTHRDTGRPRGFGFVIFEEESSARAAIEGLNDTELNGRNMKVSESRPRSEGGGGRSYGGRGGGYGGGGRGYGGGGRGYGGGSGRYGGGSGGYSDRTYGGGRSGDRYGDSGGDRYGGGNYKSGGSNY